MTWLFSTPLDARRFAYHDLGQAKTGRAITEQTEDRPRPAICLVVILCDYQWEVLVA
jgi:hypothetical protein